MTSNFSKIPRELQILRQWVAWRYEDRGGVKPTKVPYNPLTGQLADISKHQTWVSFDNAVNAVTSGVGYEGIGFVLDEKDPYTFIDLDAHEGDEAILDRQTKVYNTFDSYAEISPGGGLHIIVRGHVPSGRRRSKIELYSDRRYMTMTGNVFRDAPISSHQDALTILWEQMGKERGETVLAAHGDAPQTQSDEQLIKRAISAVNGEKFLALHEGRWQDYYPSQSEADFAYMDILAFYSQNKDQLRRLFLSSPLGQREKAHRTGYLETMLARSFDKLLPLIDLDGLAERVEEMRKNIDRRLTIAAEQAPRGQEGVVEDKTASLLEAGQTLKDFWKPQPITAPPGLLGDVMQYIYAQSYLPMAEASLVGALGFFSGLTGRAYNISGTGLNQYLLFVGLSGIGKEAIETGVTRLFTAIRENPRTKCPSVGQFFGPGEIMSGQALMKYLSTTSCCFVSMLGEVGLRLQMLTSPKAVPSELMLKKLLLDLYNKSGAGQELQRTIYSKKEDSTQVVKSPAITLVGLGTPSTIFKCMDEDMIADGLLPRFSIVEYTGDIPERNENHLLFKEPPADLVDALVVLADFCLHAERVGEVRNVTATAEAQEFLDQIYLQQRKAMNATKNEALRQLWNRVHQKTLRLAGLVAVGCNTYAPEVTPQIAAWAFNFVCIETLNMISRFQRGDIGARAFGEAHEESLMTVIKEYLKAPTGSLKSYRVDPALQDDGVIPYSYLVTRAARIKVFRTDSRTPAEAIRKTVSALIDAGELQEIGRTQIEKKYKYRGRAFVLGNPSNPKTFLTDKEGSVPTGPTEA